MKIKNKKAQYYLMAAAIIIAVILGVSVATNYIITKNKPVSFYNLGEELKEECARIIDYGIYNEIDTPGLIESFVEESLIKYIRQKDIDVEFIFVYGEKENIKIANYTNGTLNQGRVVYYTIFEDEDADFVCDGGTISGINLNNQNVLLKNCTVNGKVSVSNGGGLKIYSSRIMGNNNVFVSSGTNLELINSYVTGKVDTKDGNITIINNTIKSEVHVEGGTLFLTDNIIYGSVNTRVGDCPKVLQIGDNIVDGGISLCRGATIAIEVELFNNTYDFTSQEGINCFFVLAKEKDGEIYVLESD